MQWDRLGGLFLSLVLCRVKEYAQVSCRIKRQFAPDIPFIEKRLLNSARVRAYEL